MSKNQQTFEQFYQFYLSQHQNRVCRWLHFIGTLLLILLTVFSLYTTQYTLLWLLPCIGYGFAWIGHFVFEQNKPATFKAPVRSLLADFRLFFDMLCGHYH
nr:DUF962 domain-containing protein [Pseudoalteromonas ulvae]